MINKNGFTSEMTYYDLKKQQYSMVSPLDPFLVISDIAEISKAMMKNTSSTYFMLLCNDRRDYTVFYFNGITKIKDLEDSLLKTLQNRGEIFDIYSTSNTSWEIWIKGNDGELYCYVLFDYQDGVVEVF